jgi:hypothetical protein
MLAEIKPKNKKGQINMPFSWIFAIIVGVFIIFLAIYAATRVIDTGQQTTTAQTGQQIGVLLNPLETSFQEGQVTGLSIPVDTRINNTCGLPTSRDIFGSQGISLYQKSFGQWSKTDTEAKFENKYIFSEELIEGKNFIIFSKPFEFPFKVADLVYLTSLNKKYCFIGPPNDIEDELSALQPENIFLEDCPGDSINVCFGSQQVNCDINVNIGLDIVEKRGEVVWFEDDALMYAAIFSDKEVYECQIQRLLSRTKELAFIYDTKQTSLGGEDCSPEVNVLSLVSSIEGISNSEELIFARNTVNELDSQNNNAECRLW